MKSTRLTVILHWGVLRSSTVQPKLLPVDFGSNKTSCSHFNLLQSLRGPLAAKLTGYAPDLALPSSSQRHAPFPLYCHFFSSSVSQSVTPSDLLKGHLQNPSLRSLIPFPFSCFQRWPAVQAQLRSYDPFLDISLLFELSG